jgi:hypothetical protein
MNYLQFRRLQNFPQWEPIGTNPDNSPRSAGKYDVGCVRQASRETGVEGAVWHAKRLFCVSGSGDDYPTAI